MKTIELTSPAAGERAIREGRNEEVVVMENGHPVALVIPFDDDDLEWYARERDPAFIAAIARAREQARRGETLSVDEVKARLGLT
jgi:antitoxin (DNA-binding transcriptional repressor) of toxin-antitoxin stability system